MTTVYLYPGGKAITMEFPPPGPTEHPIRQSYVEVWETPWTNGDSLTFFQEDLNADPSQSKAIYKIDGLPALGVTAYSPDDQDQSNPAFLRIEINGIDVQVSGGESLDTLIRIAQSIVEEAPSPSPTPSPSAA